MDAQDFLDWMRRTRCRTAADIVRLLGCARGPAEAWVRAARAGEAVEVKETVRLAMTATAHHLGPWPDHQGGITR